MAFTIPPYVHGLNEKIHKKIRITVALKSYNTHRNYVPSPKDAVKKNELFGLIYHVPGVDCNLTSTHFGQTKRV